MDHADFAKPAAQIDEQFQTWPDKNRQEIAAQGEETLSWGAKGTIDIVVVEDPRIEHTNKHDPNTSQGVTASSSPTCDCIGNEQSSFGSAMHSASGLVDTQHAAEEKSASYKHIIQTRSTYPSDSHRDTSTAELWRDTSRIVNGIRSQSSVPAFINPELEARAKAGRRTILEPLFGMWQGENLFSGFAYEESLEAFRAVRDLLDNPSHRLHFLALRRQGDCCRRMENFEAAIDFYEAALKCAVFSDDKHEVLLDIGLTSLEGNRKDIAARAFSSARKFCAGSPELERVVEAGYRRATMPSGWTQTSIEGLMRSVIESLQRRDIKTLERLASPVDFVLGPLNAHPAVVPSSMAINLLVGDIGSSKLHFDIRAAISFGGRMLLPVYGIVGSLFPEGVFLSFECVRTRTTAEWEWNGILFGNYSKELIGKAFDRSRPTRDQANDLDPTPSPLIYYAGHTLDIKAPWPRGLVFRAGGASEWIIGLGIGGGIAVLELATGTGVAIGAAVSAGVAAATGPAGWLLLISGAAFALGTFIALTIHAATSPDGCIRGLGGWYYKEDNHKPFNNSTYAIDFSRWDGPYSSAVTGLPCLAVAAGFVERNETNQLRGTSSPNYVTVRHGSMMDLFREVVNMGEIRPPVASDPCPFASCYQHLDGMPGRRVGVAPYSYVDQGQRLGDMDSTGNVGWPHLHFSIHDRRSQESDMLLSDWREHYQRLGRSIMPTPMGSMVLGEFSNGKCVPSDNDMPTIHIEGGDSGGPVYVEPAIGG